MTIPNALTIAGSDSGGGAGIQADLKTFSALNVYGASVITALTAQNTQTVTAIHDIPTNFIKAQLAAIFDDILVHSIKIGMLSQSKTIITIADQLKTISPCPIILDPVMIATTGAQLIADDAIDSLIQYLFPLATLITPNLHEAARLLSEPLAQNAITMEKQGKKLIERGCQAVLIKGGHGYNEEKHSNESNDCLITPNETLWFKSKRINSTNTHGTGCTLSSAITAFLAHGQSLSVAVKNAKTYITGAIKASNQLTVGQGHGPVHHFYELWN